MFSDIFFVILLIKLKLYNMKTCKHCGQEKPLEDFVKSKITKDGTISTCIVCLKEMRKNLPKKEVTVTEKECFCCKIIKPAKAFPRNSTLNGGLHSWCKVCIHKKLEVSEYYVRLKLRKKIRLNTDEEYKLKINTAKRESRNRNREKILLHSCKNRAIQKNMEFNITIEDIVIPEICPILKQPLIYGTKAEYNFSPSVDRIDNSKGYIKGNIQIISKKANMMKNSGTVEELILFAEWINNTLTTDNS